MKAFTILAIGPSGLSVPPQAESSATFSSFGWLAKVSTRPVLPGAALGLGSPAVTRQVIRSRNCLRSSRRGTRTVYRVAIRAVCCGQQPFLLPDPSGRPESPYAGLDRYRWIFAFWLEIAARDSFQDADARQGIAKTVKTPPCRPAAEFRFAGSAWRLTARPTRWAARYNSAMRMLGSKTLGARRSRG